MLGLHESRTHRSWRFRIAVGCLVASGACLALLLLVYFVEYRFVGRFALLKIGGCSVVAVMILRGGIGRMASLSRPKVLPLLPAKVSRDLVERVEKGQVPIEFDDDPEVVVGDPEIRAVRCDAMGIRARCVDIIKRMGIRGTEE